MIPVTLSLSVGQHQTVHLESGAHWIVQTKVSTCSFTNSTELDMYKNHLMMAGIEVMFFLKKKKTKVPLTKDGLDGHLIVIVGIISSGSSKLKGFHLSHHI